MSVAVNLPERSISERDFVSLICASLCVLLVFVIGKIELKSDEVDLFPTINLSTEVVREEKNTPAPQQAKSEPQTAPSTSVTKNVSTEKPSKVEDYTSSNSSSDTSHQQVSKPSTAPTAVTSETRKADPDQAFEGKIRHLIESSKRYPTGREASLQKPQGVVVACLVLQRDGMLQEVRLQKSSTYPLLDNAAKRLLSNLQYPSIPEDIYPGHASHSFCVNLDYKAPA